MSMDDLIDRLFEEEEAREDTTPGDLAALRESLGKLNSTLGAVEERSRTERVEHQIVKRNELALERLGDQMGVFLGEQGHLLERMMTATVGPVVNAQTATAEQFEAALAAHARELRTMADEGAKRQAEFMAHMEKVANALSSPRKRTPVRDAQGEILHVRDEPWT